MSNPDCKDCGEMMAKGWDSKKFCNYYSCRHCEEDKKIEDTEEFREQAVEALMGLGLPEDEAEQQVEDYV